MSKRILIDSGILKLDKITPVIEALFGVYKIRHIPEKDLTVISYRTDGVLPQWDDIHKSLRQMASENGLELPSGDEDTIFNVLLVVARIFKTENDPFLQSLKNYHFSDLPDQKKLFYIALRFDDGHSLTRMECKYSWHYDCETLCTYNESGTQHVSRELCADTYSGHSIFMFSELQKAIAKGDIQLASQVFIGEIDHWLGFITDDQVRQSVQRKLPTLLFRMVVQNDRQNG